MNAVTMRNVARAQVRRSQFGLAATLRVTGWLAVTLLATMGVVLLFFLAIGNFTIPGTMLQLSNLASRYVAADAARQAQFNNLLATGAVIAFCAISFFRRSGLVRIFKEKTEPSHD